MLLINRDQFYFRWKKKMCLMTITCRIRMWTLSSMKTNPIGARTVAKVLGKRAICTDTLRRFMKGNGPTLAICARRVLRWNNTLISTLQVDMVLKVFIILGFYFPGSSMAKCHKVNQYFNKFWWMSKFIMAFIMFPRLIIFGWNPLVFVQTMSHSLNYSV